MLSPRHSQNDPAQPAQLEVNRISKSVGDKILWSDVSFSVRQGETLFIRGPSGVGKTLLLRALACLDPVETRCLTINGKSPDQLGIPKWRSLVTYVFQQRVSFGGTPQALYTSIQNFSSQRGRPRRHLPSIINQLGLEESVLHQPWSELSGGQAQRVQIAIAVALSPQFLLLDEPTSALDVDSARRVELVLKQCGSGLVWVSHDPNQPGRVGGRILELPSGLLSDVDAATLPPSSSFERNLAFGQEQDLNTLADGFEGNKDVEAQD